MTLRLVLVSLVAALGLTIPGTPVIENWVASTQDWMNTRFADWDSRKSPLFEEVIPKEQKLQSLLSRPRSRTTEAVVTPEVVTSSLKKTQSFVATCRTSCLRPVKLVPKCSASEALEIGEKSLSDIAFRLDSRSSRGCAVSLEGPPAPLFSRVKFDASSTLDKAIRQFTASLDTWAAFIVRSLPSFRFAVASQPRTEPGPRVKTLTTELAAEPTGKSQQLGNKREEDAAPRSHASALESFGAMEQSESLYFASDVPEASETLVFRPPASKVSAPALASSTAVCTIAAPAPSVVDDVYKEIIGCLHPFDDGFSRPAAKPAVEQQAPTVALGTQNLERKPEGVAGIARKCVIKPRFDPLEVGEDQLPAIVFDLDRETVESERASVPAEAPVALVPTAAPVPTVLPVPTALRGFTTKAEAVPMRPARDLSRALKLTREAVYAWVDALTGPAIVTVAQPNSTRIQ